MRHQRLHLSSSVITVALMTTAWATTGLAQHYTQTNLVSNVPGLAAKTDPDLVNAWGLSRSSTSPWWVADAGTGKSTLYDASGNKQSLVVTVPGVPTGTLFNGGQGFQLAPGMPARFLFVSVDGTISGWNPGVDATHAIVMVNNPGAAYTGAAFAVVQGQQFLYVANFASGRLEVYDSGFHKLTGNGTSGIENGVLSLPGDTQGLVPFNVQAIGNTVFVAFAKQDPVTHREVFGAGIGAVAAYTADGQLIRVFQQVPGLNAPWGLAMAPGDFGTFSHHLLVGQFGSGQILAFNPNNGAFAGTLQNASNQPIQIDGLWAISFGSGGTSSGPATTLFFAAGPNGETNGLFGSLAPVAADLVQGNSN